MDVVTGMIQVFGFLVLCETLTEPFGVSTPIGESILGERIYCDCVINHKDTVTDLFKLDMVEFDVILGMG